MKPKASRSNRMRLMMMIVTSGEACSRRGGNVFLKVGNVGIAEIGAGWCVAG